MDETDEPHGYVVVENFLCDVYWPNFIIGKRQRNNHQCKAFHWEFPSGQTLQISSYHHTRIKQIEEWLRKNKVDYRDGYVYLGEKEVTLHGGKDSMSFAFASAHLAGCVTEPRMLLLLPGRDIHQAQILVYPASRASLRPLSRRSSI